MRLFIWQCVDRCSNNYHHEGGVVVIACDEQAARNLANVQHGCAIRDDEPVTFSCEVAENTNPAVFIFPDAGCC